MNLTAYTLGNSVEQKVICTRSKDKWCAGRNIGDTIIMMILCFDWQRNLMAQQNNY